MRLIPIFLLFAFCSFGQTYYNSHYMSGVDTIISSVIVASDIKEAREMARIDAQQYGLTAIVKKWKRVPKKDKVNSKRIIYR